MIIAFLHPKFTFTRGRKTCLDHSSIAGIGRRLQRSFLFGFLRDSRERGVSKRGRGGSEYERRLVKYGITCPIPMY